MSDYDLLVIGAGSAGLTAAKRAAALGAKVAVVEARELGGTCVNRGCVPKKLLSYAAAFRHEFQLAASYGISCSTPILDWPTLKGAIEAELDRLGRFYQSSLEEAGVEIIRGQASFDPQGRVVVGTRLLSASHVCIAVGGVPHRPHFEGAEEAFLSDDIFRLERLPRRWVVQGSGYIGVEMASILRGLGCQVSLVFRSREPLPQFDHDLGRALAVEMANRGVDVRPECDIQSYRGGTVHTSNGSIDCDALLCAVGRRGYFQGLGLERAGVALDDKGLIRVDSRFQTSVRGVYAVGDCTSTIHLTPHAIVEGRQLAERLFGRAPATRVSPELVPTAVFSLPPLASVGLSEAQAKQRYSDNVDILQTHFRPMRMSIPNSPEKVLLKLVVRRGDQKVLGAHLLGAEAPELIQVLAIALNCGVTKEQINSTLAVHPTVAEELVFLRTPVSETKKEP